MSPETEKAIPVPDPTNLTTQNLKREIHALRDLLDARRVGLENTIHARLDAMDKALELLQHLVDRSPSIAELNARFGEQFNGIQVQFKERDTRAEQTSREGKISIDAALQAAKEAVSEQNKSNTLAIAKSEAATTKQLDLTGVTINTMVKSFDDKISDIKDRLTSIEGRATGIGQSWGFLIGAVGILGAIAAIIALILKH